MPRLPAPEEFGTELPRGDRGIVSITPDQSGKAIQDFAGRIERMAEEEAAKLDRLNTQDALTELSNAETDLAFGENGYLSRKELATKDPNFSKPFQEKYDQNVNTIAAKLNSPRAREAFLSEAAQKRMQFNRGLVTHVAREFDKAQDRTVEIKMASITQRLGFDPTQLSGQLVEFNSVAQLYRPMFGTGDEGNKSFTEWYNQKVGGIAAQAARSAISLKNFDFAEKVLKEHGRLMGGKEADDIRTTLDTQQAYTTGSQLAKQAMSMPAGKRREFIRAETEGKPAQYDVADKLLNDLEQGEKDGIRAVIGTLTAPFEAKPTEDERARIRASEAFQSLPPDAQALLERNMRNELEQQADRRRIAADRNKMSAAERSLLEASDPKRFRRFSELINEPGLGTKPPGWAQGFVGEIGKELTNKLEAEYQRQRSGRQKYSIPSELIKGHAPESLFTPARKAQLNTYLGLVESLTQDWLAHNQGTPTLADETEILQKATKRYVLDPPGLFNTKRALAYELKPIPTDFINAARATARGAGRSDPTYEQLLNAWAKQGDAYK